MSHFSRWIRLHYQFCRFMAYLMSFRWFSSFFYIFVFIEGRFLFPARGIISWSFMRSKINVSPWRDNKLKLYAFKKQDPEGSRSACFFAKHTCGESKYLAICSISQSRKSLNGWFSKSSKWFKNWFKQEHTKNNEIINGRRVRNSIFARAGGTQRPRKPRGVQGGTQRSKGSPGGSPREEMLETNSFSN